MALKIKEIEKALHANGGFISKTARALGVTPSAICNRIAKSEKLQEAKEDARLTMLDLTEAKLIEQIKEGNPTCIIFTLKTLGKERGYIEQPQNDVRWLSQLEVKENEKTITHNVLLLPDNGKVDLPEYKG